MSQLNIKQFLDAGVHFGHQTKRWNPKMRQFIFGERNKIHIVDLQKTLHCMQRALEFIEDLSAEGKNVLFVGTKKQAQLAIEQEAKRSLSFFVNQRWLGGMLTNFATIRLSIDKMSRIQKMVDANDFGHYTKKEIVSLKKDLVKLQKNLDGIKEMTDLPGALFVIDPKREQIAVQEAKKLNIPTVALIDTNCDPEGIEYLIPGNDDAIRSIALVCQLIADAALKGKTTYSNNQRRSNPRNEVTEAALQQFNSEESKEVHPL